MYRYVLHVTVVGYTVFFFDNVKGHEQAISKYGELWRYTWKLWSSAFSAKAEVSPKMNLIHPVEIDWRDVKKKKKGAFGYQFSLLSMSEYVYVNFEMWINKPHTCDPVENKSVGLWSLWPVKNYIVARLEFCIAGVLLSLRGWGSHNIHQHRC